MHDVGEADGGADVAGRVLFALLTRRCQSSCEPLSQAMFLCLNTNTQVHAHVHTSCVHNV